MKWVLFTGTWQNTSKEVEVDVRNTVKEVLSSGNGVLTGGALGVDFFALDEALKHDRDGKKIRVILPTKLHFYEGHFYKAVEEGRVALENFQNLFDALHNLVLKNSNAVLELNNKEINQTTYYERNFFEVCFADEVYAFQVNNSLGTQDTIDKARERGVPCTLHKKYSLG